MTRQDVDTAPGREVLADPASYDCMGRVEARIVSVPAYLAAQAVADAYRAADKWPSAAQTAAILDAVRALAKVTP